MRLKLALPALLLALSPLLHAKDEAPVATLQNAKIDLAPLKDAGTRSYAILQIGIDGTDKPLGTFTTKTTVEKDHILFEDTMTFDNKSSTLKSKVTPAPTFPIREATILYKRGDVESQGAVTIKNGEMFLTADGNEKTVGKVIDNSISIFGYFRLVTLLPRKPGGTWSLDGILNDYKWRWLEREGITIECKGPQKTIVNGKEKTWTHFILSFGPKDKEKYEAWLDEKGLLREIYVDNMKFVLEDK